MSRNILLILANAAAANAVRRSLTDVRDGPFQFELLHGCGEAIKRLGDKHREEIAAVVVDLFLADSQGIDTFDKLSRASPHIPILVLSHRCDERIARLAVQRGAQDYLLHERLDGYWLSKALDNMLERCAYAEVLFLERERAQVTLNSIGDAVISTDVAGNVTYLNEVAESMTGWSRQEASGRRLPEVLHIIDGERREPALNPLAMAMLYNKTVGLSSNCVLVRRHGQVTGAVIVFHDVGAARAMALRMSHLAQHDFLTELPNRMLLNDRLTQAIASAHRHSKSLA